MPQQTIIVGATEAGRQLAERLEKEGESVSVIDTDESLCALAREIPGVRVFCADATDVHTLQRAGAEDAHSLVAVTPSDKLNLLVCQVARATFGLPRLIGRATNPASRSAFETSGIETIAPETAEAVVVEQMLLRPSLFEIMRHDQQRERLTEVAVQSNAAVGQTLAALRLHGCVVVALRRKTNIVVPTGRTRLRRGDVLTLMGTDSAIDGARLLLSSADATGTAP